jgi:uracil-DNA glycosylase
MSWLEVYAHNDFHFTSLPVPKGWETMFNYINEHHADKIKELDTFLNDCIKRETVMYPFPCDIFAAFDLFSLKELKVLIIGQDCYINEQNGIPQATGVAFSVKEGIDIPPSLKNMHTNLYNNKHITVVPTHGNLTKWMQQGVLLLNTALTVTAGFSNSHKVPWVYITNGMLQYISDNTEGICFMLWGGNALCKLNYIDTNKHYVTISSHPSPMSYNSKLQYYPSFKDSNHFKNVNDFLIKNNKTPIDWNV